MSIEQRMDAALLDFEGLLAEMTVQKALSVVATEHGLRKEAVLVRAQDRFGDLRQFASSISDELHEAFEIEEFVENYRNACLAGEEPHLESLLRIDPLKAVYRFSHEKCNLIRQRCEKIKVAAWIERGDEIDWYDSKHPMRVIPEEEV